MKADQTPVPDFDLEIEILDQHEELLVAAAGTTCCGHVKPAIEVITVE
jgi:hypothetical protein